MSAILPTFYIILLLGLTLLGLILVAVGSVLLLRSKNKLAGGLTTAVGTVFTIFPLIILLAILNVARIQG